MSYFSGPEGHVTICDINSNMLEVGKKRAQNMGYNPNQISWKVGDAQNLEFPDDTFDAYTIAYGIRNVVDINKALREAYRYTVWKFRKITHIFLTKIS